MYFVYNLEEVMKKGAEEGMTFPLCEFVSHPLLPPKITELRFLLPANRFEMAYQSRG